MSRLSCCIFALLLQFVKLELWQLVFSFVGTVCMGTAGVDTKYTLFLQTSKKVEYIKLYGLHLSHIFLIVYR